jgi:hypothetical protein
MIVGLPAEPVLSQGQGPLTAQQPRRRALARATRFATALTNPRPSRGVALRLSLI